MGCRGRAAISAPVKAMGARELTVRRRQATGTRRARRLRLAGVIPGVVYGRDLTPVAVAVNQRELTTLLHSRTGEHTLVTLRVEDGAAWEQPALVQVVQHDPVNGRVVHVDFHAVRLTERLKVKVPVVLKGEPIGVKQAGGILEQFLREVEVECLPTEIPASLEYEVSALAIGQTVHVRDLIPPTHATLTEDPDGVIASVQTPKAEQPAEAAAVAEPEVIRERKEAAEAPAQAEQAKDEKPARPVGEGRPGAGAPQERG